MQKVLISGLNDECADVRLEFGLARAEVAQHAAAIIDRRSYRPPADLKRWLGLRDEHCAFAGCGRRAAECNLDHRVAWAEGGSTSVENLAHLCRHHHRLKHEGGWRSERASSGASRWTSLTGATHDPDLPPF